MYIEASPVAYKVSRSNVQNHLILAKEIIESLNVSRTYFIVAINLSQKLSLIAGIRSYHCKPIQLVHHCSNNYFLCGKIFAKREVIILFIGFALSFVFKSLNDN